MKSSCDYMRENIPASQDKFAFWRQTIVTPYFILISSSMQLQQIVQTYFTHQRRIIDAILAISLRKKNHLVRRMGMMRLKHLQRRPRSIWYKDGGNDMFWQNLVNGKHGDEKWKKNFHLTTEKFYEQVDMLRPYISPILQLKVSRHLSRPAGMMRLHEKKRPA